MSRQPNNRREFNGNGRDGMMFTGIGMGPSSVIDFVHPVSMAQEGGGYGPNCSVSMEEALDPFAVKGGPPAYLEAQGVRYVPAMPDTPNVDDEYPDDAPLPPLQKPRALVPMNRPYETLKEPTKISEEDLNARVDERIKHFLDNDVRKARSAADSVSDRLERLHAKLEAQVHSNERGARSRLLANEIGSSYGAAEPKAGYSAYTPRELGVGRDLNTDIKTRRARPVDLDDW